MTAREKRVEKAQMRVLFQVPFFAPGVAKLPVVFDETVDTACTSGDNIRFNPTFFDGLKDPEVVTVLAHETAHCLLGHIWRAPAGCDWGIWNQAIDHATNNMLKEFGEQVIARRLADPFPFPDGQWCMDPQFRGLSEEEIYSRLAAKGGGGGGGTGKPGQPGAGGGKPGIGQIAPAKNQTPQQAKAAKTAWDDTLIQSVNAMKGRGELPGSVGRFVDELINPNIPWWELLRVWLREQINDDYDWTKPNPLFDEADFQMPSLHNDGMGPVVFATDTSGSIDADMLRHFQSEKQNCLDDMKPSKLTDLYCDTRVTKAEEYLPGDRIDRSAPGGGGTDFRPVFDRLAEMNLTPKCLVYLTDLDGHFPVADPGYPVLWVVYGGGDKAPFGEVVQAS